MTTPAPLVYNERAHRKAMFLAWRRVNMPKSRQPRPVRKIGLRHLRCICGATATCSRRYTPWTFSDYPNRCMSTVWIIAHNRSCFAGPNPQRAIDLITNGVPL